MGCCGSDEISATDTIRVQQTLKLDKTNLDKLQKELEQLRINKEQEQKEDTLALHKYSKAKEEFDQLKSIYDVKNNELNECKKKLEQEKKETEEVIKKIEDIIECKKHLKEDIQANEEELNQIKIEVLKINKVLLI